MWQYQNTDELYHYGVLGMRWGHRKSYFQALRDAKKARKNRDRQILDRVYREEKDIEKGYKRGQMMSKRDQQRELVVDNRATKDWAASKAQYKKDRINAKNTYKSNIQKMKNTTKYKRHKENMKTVGKEYLKNVLENTAIAAVGIGVSLPLVRNGKNKTGLAIANLAKTVAYANTGRHIYRTYRRIKKNNNNN